MKRRLDLRGDVVALFRSTRVYAIKVASREASRLGIRYGLIVRSARGRSLQRAGSGRQDANASGRRAKRVIAQLTCLRSRAWRAGDRYCRGNDDRPALNLHIPPCLNGLK
jgi:hypothetical protein